MISQLPYDDEAPTGTQRLLSDLARVKAHFQLRSIAAILGLPANHHPHPGGENEECEHGHNGGEK